MTLLLVASHTDSNFTSFVLKIELKRLWQCVPHLKSAVLGVLIPPQDYPMWGWSENFEGGNPTTGFMTETLAEEFIAAVTVDKRRITFEHFK